MSLSKLKREDAEDWKSEESLTSFRTAIAAEQRVVGRSCQRWFTYSRDQIQAIKLRIACSLFQCGPDGVEHEMARLTDILEAYDPEQRRVIGKIFASLMTFFAKNVRHIKVSRIMVGLKNADGETRAFILAVRTDAADASTAFIDHFGRRYKDWDDFMRKNRLPKCYLVFPRNGIYIESKEGEYVLDNEWLNTGFNLAKYLDYVATVFGVVAGAVLFASIFCPLIAPIVLTGAALVAGVSSLWGGIRCAQDLHDRAEHGQSLTDKEAALLWAGLIAAVVGGLGAVGSGVTSGVLQLADEITLGVRFQMGMRILRITSAVLAPAGGLAGAIAATRVGSGRLSPACEAALIGLSVFLAGNVLLSMDQAHQLRMLAGCIENVGTGIANGVHSIDRAIAAAVEFLRRQPGIDLDAQQVPLVVAEELSNFGSALSEAASAAFLGHVVRRCQEATISSSAEESDSVIETADEDEEGRNSTDGDEWSTIS